MFETFIRIKENIVKLDLPLVFGEVVLNPLEFLKIPNGYINWKLFSEEEIDSLCEEITARYVYYCSDSNKDSMLLAELELNCDFINREGQAKRLQSLFNLHKASFGEELKFSVDNLVKVLNLYKADTTSFVLHDVTSEIVGNKQGVNSKIVVESTDFMDVVKYIEINY